ncbi:hypothetical protein, partial [Natronoarchaeum mannanilyticum]|uniref:hypothetical protein n=1 Tax=Natronoarchaeum mannanilyticum TaxID=926360 RepID=UPI00366E6F5A
MTESYMAVATGRFRRCHLAWPEIGVRNGGRSVAVASGQVDRDSAGTSPSAASRSIHQAAASAR